MDLYTHTEILEAVEAGRRYRPVLTQLMFGREIYSNQRTIGFDEVVEDRTIAPLVIPEAKAPVSNGQAFSTTTLSPAYTKESKTVNYTDVTTRRAGEPLPSSLSPEQRYALILRERAQMLTYKQERLVEYMASQLIKTGKVEMTNTQYGTYTLDFGRAAGNTSTLTGTALWDDAAASPVDSLETFIGTMVKPAATVVFGSEAWAQYRADSKFKDVMNNDFTLLSGQSSQEFGPIQMGEDSSTRFVGFNTSLGVMMYVTKETLSVAGSSYSIVDSKSVAVIPSTYHGVMGYGAIQDASANFQSFKIFYKNWITEDPGLPYVKAETAPAPFHTAIDATGYLTVLA